jgi:hypothetical protein
MGQMQNRESEGKREESSGGAVKHDLKDRIGASFQGKQAVNPATGTGSKGNPGKPQ